MIFTPSPEKLRARRLADAKLELEQRTLQAEEIAAITTMLRKRIDRLEAQVQADELAQKKRQALKRMALQFGPALDTGGPSAVPPRRPPPRTP